MNLLTNHIEAARVAEETHVVRCYFHEVVGVNTVRTVEEANQD